ncbi:MAG: hypothetical protein HUU02_06420 [Bacteroidetes bacterium]|nr:hypothetical protein [Bacteroidota bacterium]
MSSPLHTGPAAGRRIGALRDLYTRPLYHTLQSSSGSPEELLFDTPSAHLDALMSNERAAVFVPPVDFAQNSSGMVLIPKVGVSSSGHSNAVRLYLRRNLPVIRSIAVGAVSATDVVLARIVLGEKYDAEQPTVVPVQGTVEEMLSKADCALVAGDALLTLAADHPFIDIVDEWSDITELPFVHTVAITRSDLYTAETAERLLASMDAGRAALPSVANAVAAETSLSADLLQNYLSHFSYGLDDESLASLDEFFRMAFYYGMLGDVPEIETGR